MTTAYPRHGSGVLLLRQTPLATVYMPATLNARGNFSLSLFSEIGKRNLYFPETSLSVTNLATFAQINSRSTGFMPISGFVGWLTDW